MSEEEFIKQRCEIDKITEEEFEKRYRVVKCDCGQPYCKGYRCLDLDGLLKENQELKKQVQDLKADYGTIAQIERDLYKDVIEEVREYIEDWLFNAGGNGASMNYEDINELLQILDKAKN